MRQEERVQASAGTLVMDQEARTSCFNGEFYLEWDNMVTFCFTELDLSLRWELVWRQGAPLGATAVVLVREMGVNPQH